MASITVISLSTPGNLSVRAREALLAAPRIFLHTTAHPSTAFMKEAFPYTSMDDLFESAVDFDALNSAIADRLCETTEDVAYAIPGRGMGAALAKAVYAAASRVGMEILHIPGTGYAEAAMAAIPGGFFADDLRIVSAFSLPRTIDPCAALCVEELDTSLRASEVKLALNAFYPDDYQLWFCVMAENGGYDCHSIPLCELDRQPKNAYFAATTLLLPAAEFSSLTQHGMENLLRVMERLRGPGGCPWDAEQDHMTLRSTLLEESYEVLDAIDKKDPDDLCEELGDLLLQVVFHAQIEAEKRVFTMRDVCTGIVNKLIYRHPHVFGSIEVKGTDEVLYNWEQLKKKEKHLETATEAIAAIPKGFPALLRAYKVQKKAANIGFDWDSAETALPKIYEEADELQEAMAAGNTAHIDEEMGDLLFACVNVARLLHVDPELMLYEATEKFSTRFAAMEAMVRAEGLRLEGMQLSEMDKYWSKIKKSPK